VIGLRTEVEGEAPSRLEPGDAAVVPVFYGLEAASSPLAALDVEFCRRRGFEGKTGQALAMPAGEGGVVVAVGLGEAGKPDAERLRRAAASAVREAWEMRRLVWDLEGIVERGADPFEVAQAVAEGAALASYRFDRYKNDPSPALRLESLTIAAAARGPVASGAKRGARVAEAVGLARDLVNEPASDMTPSRLAEVAAQVAGGPLAIEVMEESDMASAGLGGLLGVARGSSEPPRLIRLRYEPPGANGQSQVPTVALVGKGITFDSGGLSLKTAEGMTAMKTDMGGAAVVVATLSALPDLDLGVRVLGLVPATENMPGEGALKPGDVLRIRNGKTIEVLNTDAEGRLILADALSLAVEERPDAVVDLATLTGACVVALGRRIAGLMGNDLALVERVRAAAERAGEPVWHLPLPADYRSQIDSDVADMKNIGKPGEAGTLAAGLLLQEFAGEVPWAHLDIAGPARSDEDTGYLRKGGTGFGVRTLVELLSDFARC
jgi:leucyl aminopeptidase